MATFALFVCYASNFRPQILLMLMDFSRPSFDRQKHVFVSLNDFCNRRCTYCYVPESSLSRSRPVEIAALILGLERLYHEHGFRLLTVAGGEPGLVRNLDAFLQEISMIGYNVIINTNGTLTPQRIKDIRKYNIRAVSFSLDSCNPEVNDELRFRGSWDLVNRGVQFCREEGIPIRITSVVCSKNQHDVLGLFDWCNAVGVDVLNVHELDISVNPTLLGPLKLLPTEWRELVRKLAVGVHNMKCHTALRLPISYLTESESRLIAEHDLSCPATHNDTLCVTPDLSTYRCPLLINQHKVSYRGLKDAFEQEPLDGLTAQKGCARCPLSGQEGGLGAGLIDACKLVKVTINRVSDGTNTPIWADVVRKLQPGCVDGSLETIRPTGEEG